MADSQSMASAAGPPYPFPIAILGGTPTPEIDDPIAGVFLAIFISLAVTHMTIFQINRKNGHKFLFSALLFGLSMARSVAMILRIVWASYPDNTNIALAANIFTQAGVVILFVANLFFAQRIVRAYLPGVGWHKATTAFFRSLVVCVILSLVMVIVCTVHSSFTLDRVAQDKDRKVQLTAGTFFAVLAFVPIPTVLGAMVLSKYYRSKKAQGTLSDSTSDSDSSHKHSQQHRGNRPEKFGTGSMRAKLALILFSATLLTLGAAFRVSTSFLARPRNDPAWYTSRACYYCFNFVIEVIVSASYAAARFDRRFHVPNGSKGPGDYARGRNEQDGAQQEVESGSVTTAVPEEEAGVHSVGPRFSRNVNTEEEVFGGDDDDEEETSKRRTTEKLEV